MKKTKNILTGFLVSSIILSILACSPKVAQNATPENPQNELISQQEIESYTARFVKEPYTLISVTDGQDKDGFPEKIYTFKCTDRDLKFVTVAYFWHDVGMMSGKVGTIPEKTGPTYMTEVRLLYKDELNKIVNTYPGSVQDWFEISELNLANPDIYDDFKNAPGKLFKLETVEDVKEFARICEECNKLFKNEPGYNDGIIREDTLNSEVDKEFYHFLANTEQTSYTHSIDLTGDTEEITFENIILGFEDTKYVNDIPGLEEYIKEVKKETIKNQYITPSSENTSEEIPETISEKEIKEETPEETSDGIAVLYNFKYLTGSADEAKKAVEDYYNSTISSVKDKDYSQSEGAEIVMENGKICDYYGSDSVTYITDRDTFEHIWEK